jgi:hypothetical protein
MDRFGHNLSAIPLLRKNLLSLCRQAKKLLLSPFRFWLPLPGQDLCGGHFLRESLSQFSSVARQLLPSLDLKYGGSGRGGSNCGFYSFERCMANAWGNGGFCRRNAFEDPYWTGRTTYRRYRRGD